jgi:Cdc6-like AAA superfamily ATPase
MKRQSRKAQLEELITSGTTEERVRYFKSYIAAHRTLDNAKEEALTVLQCDSRQPLMVIAGPTGVGKTTLFKHLREALRQRFKDDNPDLSPVMWGNAVSPQKGDFSWKNFHVRLLEKYGDILPERKIAVPPQRSFWPELLPATRAEQRTDETLRLAVEKCMHHRGTKMLLIDEAHHILMARKADSLERQFETIKSLEAATGATIVMVGTHKLLKILDLSSQLARRSRIVHFPHYDANLAEDRDAFASVLNELQDQLPISLRPDLMPEWAYFMAKSGGCVGVLKDWLTLALEIALRRNVPLTLKLLERHAHPNRAISTMLEDAWAGESQLVDISNDELLGRIKRHGITVSSSQTAKPQHPKGRKVGQRKPTRDPVGFKEVA